MLFFLQSTELLLHPVVISLLRWKWTRYIAWFYFLNLGLYLTFVGFLTAFALTVPNPQLQACKEAEIAFSKLKVYTSIYKYEKHFPKMLKDVRMVVPKPTETRYRDGGHHTAKRDVYFNIAMVISVALE